MLSFALQWVKQKGLNKQGPGGGGIARDEHVALTQVAYCLTKIAFPR